MKQIPILIIILIFSFNCYSKDDLLIGVLEQPKCKQQQELSVRVLFGKEGDEFIPLDSQEEAEKFKTDEINWTIAYDGKNRGSITSYDPKQSIVNDWTFSRDKLHKLNVSQKPLKIKSNSLFSGWCGSPIYRPIVLVSKKNFKDPQSWKPFKPKRKILNILLPTIKETISDVVIINPDTYKKTPLQYSAKDLTLFKSYKSLSEGKLIQVGFDIKNIDCGGEIDPECPSQWFYVGNNSNVIYLGVKLELVDAGDYDNDGNSEIVFWYSGNNDDGYVMYYNNFKNTATFSWKYH
ncbi:MAG: hypothetical protein IMY67_11890 [Bacteroidetes bacterium]|nr:hypothetical protein [Bacteroidota bacterium]